MKKVIFTTLLLFLAGKSLMLFAQYIWSPHSPWAQSPEGSTGWETLMPNEPLVLEEDFQDFPFFHSDQNPDQGNSATYKDTTAFRRCIASIDTIFYDFYQCAFAPNWIAAYAFKDSLTQDSPCDPTPQVTRGFVEISREREQDLTVDGHFIIDLRQMEYVEVVQYSHSSCGGNKRGFTLAMSTDDGETWDTVRWQHAYPDIAIPQPNSYNCQNSACAMRWEDPIFNMNVMLRFTQAYGQAVRIQDLKVYGTVDPATGITDYVNEEIEITWYNKVIRLSEIADVGIYNMNGTLVKRADQVETLSTSDLPDGVYIVRARTDVKITTVKIVNK